MPPIAVHAGVARERNALPPRLAPAPPQPRAVPLLPRLLPFATRLLGLDPSWTAASHCALPHLALRSRGGPERARPARPTWTVTTSAPTTHGCGANPGPAGAGPGFIDPAESRAQPSAGSVWGTVSSTNRVWGVGEPGRSLDRQVVEALRRERHVPVDGLPGRTGVRAPADLAVVDLVAFLPRRSTRSGGPWSGRTAAPTRS